MRIESSLFACALALAVGACGPQPPAPATPPAPPPASGEPAAQTPAAEPAAAPATPAPPSATIAEVQLSRESAMDKRVKVVFANPTRSACTITRYVLTWPGGSKPATPAAFRLPAGESRERWLVVHPNDGDLGALTKDAASITIETDCAAP